MDIIYDGRTDNLYYNDLILTTTDCSYVYESSSYYFIGINKVIDYGRIMLVCCMNKTYVFDKIFHYICVCNQPYVYSLFYDNHLYEWYKLNNGFCRCISSIHNIYNDLEEEEVNDNRLPLDPVIMFLRNCKADHSKISYGIDLMKIYKSRGLNKCNGFADITFIF